MTCPICAGEIEWVWGWRLYECVRCVRRWLQWPPPYAARIMLGMRHLKTDQDWYAFWRIFPNGAWK